MKRSADAWELLRASSRRCLTAAVGGSLFLPISLALAEPAWPVTTLLPALGLLVGGFLLGLAAFGKLVETHGPRHSQQAFVLATTLFLVVPVLAAVLDLPDPVYFVVAMFLGMGCAGIVRAQIGLERAFPALVPERQRVLIVAAAVAVALASLLLTQTAAYAFGAFAILMATSLPLLSKIPDPVVRISPFAVYIPWRLEDGARRPLGPRWWTRFPAHLVYTFGTTVLFAVWILVFDADRARVPEALTWSFVYYVPNLFQDIPRTIVNFATGIWFNHHPVQVVYVFVLFALFGIWFEIHEGSRRAIAVFYGTSIFAGISAGVFLHAIRALWDATWIEDAWSHAWNGGSAGAFGLAGGYAARARKPWLLIATLLFWELNVELWHLRSYTVAFHVAALACGFVWVRYAMPARAPAMDEPSRDAA